MNFVTILRYSLLILLVLFALTRLVPHLGDFKKVWELRDALAYPWIFAALISQLTQYLGDGLLSQILLSIVNVKISLKNSIRIAALNVFAAHLLPVGEAGGLAAAYTFYKKLGVTTEKFIFLTLSWGLIMNGLLFLFLLGPLLILDTLPLPNNVWFWSIAICSSIFAIAIILFFNRKYVYHTIHTRFHDKPFAKDVFQFISNRHSYFKIIRQHPLKLSLAVLSGFFYYASNVATLYFSFAAFDVYPPIMLVTFAYAASLLFGRLTLAPAGIGATEASLAIIFYDAGINAPVTLAAVLTYRLISFWLPIPGGFFSYLSLRKGKVKAIPQL